MLCHSFATPPIIHFGHFERGLSTPRPSILPQRSTSNTLLTDYEPTSNAFLRADTIPADVVVASSHGIRTRPLRMPVHPPTSNECHALRTPARPALRSAHLASLAHFECVHGHFECAPASPLLTHARSLRTPARPLLNARTPRVFCFERALQRSTSSCCLSRAPRPSHSPISNGCPPSSLQMRAPPTSNGISNTRPPISNARPSTPNARASTSNGHPAALRITLRPFLTCAAHFVRLPVHPQFERVSRASNARPPPCFERAPPPHWNAPSNARPPLELSSTSHAAGPLRTHPRRGYAV
ncbi:hypothetical protein K438DRAFT_2028887 [Mycena galopus ATCC 62051]|nr:hypothetical protein K438DRAFT_2028887 [Mycena galopus ATCC 62051]